MAYPWRLGAVVFLCAAVMAPGAACALRTSRPGRDSSVHELSTHVALHGGELTLHVADGRAPGSGPLPLVVYGSGDGGWFGAAVGMFKMIAAGGYPAVGFSSRALLETGRRALALPPGAPAVLTGWSRGASLAVLAAAEPETDRGVTGVVAIGLP